MKGLLLGCCGGFYRRLRSPSEYRKRRGRLGTNETTNGILTAKWYSGTGVPSVGQGEDGDLYLDIAVRLPM